MIEKLAKPYFHCEWTEDGRCISEDNVFCDSVRKAGFEVWLDPVLSRELVHLGQVPLRVSDAVPDAPKLQVVHG